MFQIFLFYSPAYASPLGDIIREIDEASAKIFNFCTYSIKYKDGIQGGPDTLMTLYMGNAFFIEHAGPAHFALTNKHILQCATEKENLPLPDDKLIDAVASFTSTSSLRTKWGGQYYKTTIAGMLINGNPNIDFAILEVEWPANSPLHHHNLVLSDEKTYDLGSELIVRGFMPCGDVSFCDEDGWVRRLKFTQVEGITKDKVYVQMNTSGYSGMSGSPVIILKDNKPYVIGIFSVAYITSRYGSADISWAVRLKKEYFDPPPPVEKQKTPS